MTDIQFNTIITESGLIENYQPCHNRTYVANTYPLQMTGIPLQSRDTLPSIPAIYFAISNKTGLLYIGRARNLNERWRTHHRFPQLEKYGDVIIAWITSPQLTDEDLSDLESAYIREFIPPLNQSPVKDDFVDVSGRDLDKYYYTEVKVLKDSDFSKYVNKKYLETGVKPRDQILLYANTHVDMLRGISRR